MKTRRKKMKTLLVSSYFLCHSLVLAGPQNRFSSFADTARSSFSNFNPNSQTFSAGTNTKLSQQTFSSSQDNFFQSLDTSLDQLFPTTGLGGSGFDGLANTGFNTNDFLDPSIPLDVFASSTGKFE